MGINGWACKEVYAEEETSFEIYEPFGLTAYTDGIFYQNTKGNKLEGISYIPNENGACTINLTGNLKDKTYKLYIKVIIFV